MANSYQIIDEKTWNRAKVPPDKKTSWGKRETV